MWPDSRLMTLFGTEVPIVQAPMANTPFADLVAGACLAGGLGSLACAMLSADKVRELVGVIRLRTQRPFALNFFCHTPTDVDPAREADWRARLAPYYKELELDPSATLAGASREPFNDAMCGVVEELKPKVVSFHFGLPDPALYKRVKATGAIVMGCATTVAEARWLEEREVDVVIAQGAEAGGHRGLFLSESVASQPGLFALLPQVVDAVKVPVVAAGGIADGRGIVAALALGAAGVSVGTAYLGCPEARISPLYREALSHASDDSTVLTTVMTGRPARGLVNRLMAEIGPMADAPAFPHAAGALAPLRAAAEKRGRADFSPLWAGQAAPLTRSMPAEELTRTLAGETLQQLRQLAEATSR